MKAASSAAIALLGATVVAGIALSFRLAGPGGVALGPDSMPLLFIAACLCTAALLRRRAPASSWLAIVTAGGLGAIEVVGSVRAFEAGASPGVWPWLVASAEIALVGSAGVAAAYVTRGSPGDHATEPALTTRAWRVVVIASMAGVGAIGVWATMVAFAGELLIPAAAQGGSTELSPLRVSGRLAVGFVAVAVVVGVWRDVAALLRRARSTASGVADLPRALGEELLPSASAFRRRGREEERARLAADLHALVLPDLRRAARTAEAAGDAGQPLAADLRHAVEGVERLMHERQSVVLEEFGLVAALEWLAERTQEQGAFDVVVELEDVIDDPGTLPKRVIRGAFRVALLAVDNVLRHAGATRVELRLDVHGAALALSVVDDGRRAAAQPGPVRGRGLADMRTAAIDVGGSVDVRSSPGGTTVEFRWAGAGPVAADHATPIADSTDGPDSLHR